VKNRWLPYTYFISVYLITVASFLEVLKGTIVNTGSAVGNFFAVAQYSLWITAISPVSLFTTVALFLGSLINRKVPKFSLFRIYLLSWPSALALGALLQWFLIPEVTRIYTTLVWAVISTVSFIIAIAASKFLGNNKTN
jgi:hypothetical protein